MILGGRKDAWSRDGEGRRGRGGEEVWSIKSLLHLHSPPSSHAFIERASKELRRVSAPRIPLVDMTLGECTDERRGDNS